LKRQIGHFWTLLVSFGQFWSGLGKHFEHESEILEIDALWTLLNIDERKRLAGLNNFGIAFCTRKDIEHV
jgi:hypothetical protein